MKARIRDLLPASAPRWLQGEWSQKWLKSTGVVLDLTIEAMQQAQKGRFPVWTPDVLLGEQAQNRALDQLPGEPNSAFRGRLQDAFRWHEIAGTGGHDGVVESGLVQVLRQFGFQTIQVIQGVSWAGSRNWATAVLYLPQIHNLGSPVKYGSGRKYGDGFCYGVSGVDRDYVRKLRKIVNQYKGSHVRIDWLVAETDGIIYGVGHKYGVGWKYGSNAARIRLRVDKE